MIVIAVHVLQPANVSAQSTAVWTNRFGGTANGMDMPNALAVAPNGDVVMGGAVATSVIGADNFVTIRYSSAGAALWTNYYNGPGNSYDFVNAVAVDAGGNVVVTGGSRSTSSSTSEDYATIRYSADGVPLWTNRYAGGGNSGDRPMAVVTDVSSNVVVTGSAQLTASVDSVDIVTIKYSAAGTALWTNTYNGPANSYDTARCMALDASGSVFVAGYATATNLWPDLVVIKYSSAGVALWTNLFGGSFNRGDEARAIVVDGSSNVVITGYTTATGNQNDFVTIKYSNAGVPLWTNIYAGPSNDEDKPASVAVDASDNVFVTGFSTGSGGNWDYATIKYSSAGVPLWTNRYNGPGNGDDMAEDIVVDSAGNVHVTGLAEAGGLLADFVTVTYNNSGAGIRTNRFNNGPGNTTDEAVAIVVDSIGNTIVTGWADVGLQPPDIITIKYASLVPASLSPIPLNHQRIGNQLVLTWTNAAFGLQSAPNITGTYTNVTGATSPHTNSLSQSQWFFRLKSN